MWTHGSFTRSYLNKCFLIGKHENAGTPLLSSRIPFVRYSRSDVRQYELDSAAVTTSKSQWLQAEVSKQCPGQILLLSAFVRKFLLEPSHVRACTNCV